MIDQASRNRLIQQRQTQAIAENMAKAVSSAVTQAIPKPTPPSPPAPNPETQKLTQRIGQLADTLASQQVTKERVLTPAETLANELKALQRTIGGGNLIETLRALTDNLSGFSLDTEAVGSLKVLVEELSTKIRLLTEIEAKIPTKIAVNLENSNLRKQLEGMSVTSSPVEVEQVKKMPPISINNLDEVVRGLSQVMQGLEATLYKAIIATKVTIPDSVSVKSPVQMVGMNDLLDGVEEMKKGFNIMIKALQESKGMDSEKPMMVEIVKDLPRPLPTPVTNISLNSLGGVVKSTAVVVATTATALPATALADRRNVVFYNNDSSLTVFVGGSGVTTAAGIPVPPGTYSPAMDIGDNMSVYGIVTSGTADVRVLELSDIAVGR